MRHKLSALILPVITLCWTASAALGLSAIWIAVPESAGDDERFTRRCYMKLACLVLGATAGVAWLAVMSTAPRTYDLETWAVWLVLLSGPLLVGLRHSVRLLGRTGHAAQPAAGGEGNARVMELGRLGLQGGYTDPEE